MSTPNFVPLSEEEFIERRNQAGYLNNLKFEHSQIIALPQIGTFDHFLKVENRGKIRYDCNPCWDATRVKIIPKGNSTDYVHANYVDSFGFPKKYIATQGPLKQTIEEFWQLIWEQNSRIIVMLTELCVDGEEKCAPYWYTYDNKERTFQNNKLSIKTVNERKKSGYVETIFDVCNHTTGESRQIKHYLYFDWPDGGVPSNSESFMGLILEVNEERQRLLKEMADGPAPGPIIVHCSIGVGRTGTYCAVDSCVYQLAKTRTVSVPETVTKIREQRFGSLMAQEQYIYANKIFARSPEVRDSFCAF